jgi:hypothetical protein
MMQLHQHLILALLRMKRFAELTKKNEIGLLHEAEDSLHKIGPAAKYK